MINYGIHTELQILQLLQVRKDKELHKKGQLHHILLNTYVTPIGVLGERRGSAGAPRPPEAAGLTHSAHVQGLGWKCAFKRCLPRVPESRNSLPG